MSQILGLMPEPKIQFFDNNGRPLAGGLLYTYSPGKPGVFKPTYTSAIADENFNTNPIVLDAAGRASVWLDGFYYMELKSATGITIWTQDNVSLIGADNLLTVLINAESSPQTITVLDNRRDTTYIKTDPSSNTITLVAAEGYSFKHGQSPVLYNQYESITVRVDTENTYELSGDNIVPFFSNNYSPVSPTSAELIYLNALTSDAEVTLSDDNSEYIIVRTDIGSSFTATINAPIGYTIENTSSYELTLGGESVHLMLIGNNYYSI